MVMTARERKAQSVVPRHHQGEDREGAGRPDTRVDQYVKEFLREFEADYRRRVEEKKPASK